MIAMKMMTALIHRFHHECLYFLLFYTFPHLTLLSSTCLTLLTSPPPPPFYPYLIPTQIGAQISDLRSVVCKEACRTTALLARRLGPLFSPLAELWLPVLFKLLGEWEWEGV